MYYDEIQLSESPDVPVWKWESKKIFRARSLIIKHPCSPISGADYTCICKSKLPLKIRIFLWQLFLNAVQTKKKSDPAVLAGQS